MYSSLSWLANKLSILPDSSLLLPGCPLTKNFSGSTWSYYSESDKPSSNYLLIEFSANAAVEEFKNGK